MDLPSSLSRNFTSSGSRVTRIASHYIPSPRQPRLRRLLFPSASLASPHLPSSVFYSALGRALKRPCNPLPRLNLEIFRLSSASGQKMIASGRRWWQRKKGKAQAPPSYTRAHLVCLLLVRPDEIHQPIVHLARCRANDIRLVEVLVRLAAFEADLTRSGG